MIECFLFHLKHRNKWKIIGCFEFQKHQITIEIGENYMNKKTEESRIAYNKIASEYDMSREGQYTRFHIMELSNTVDLSAGNVVLDVACGNGTLLRELSKKAKIQANGIDISENMIYSAKMRYPNMNFEVKSCYPLEWSDESIDIITVCCAFHHFDNPQGFVR